MAVGESILIKATMVIRQAGRHYTL